MKAQYNSAKPIGGYIGLQIPKGSSYYPALIPLNTGRNALEYILKIKKYSTIYMPYFTCEVLLEPIKKLGVNYQFYKLNEDLDPIIDFEMDDRSCLLYTNYFGIKTSTVKSISKSIKNLIIDNAQAFYSAPFEKHDTFYSCRKFFGVPDGAYLYSSNIKRLNLKVDHSTSRFSHLIKSIDFNIEDGYSDFLENNKMLNNNEIKRMSSLTEQLLGAIDYEQCARIRKNNFNYLHKYLKKINILKVDFADEDVPMVYPLLLDDSTLREKLINNKIFIPTYWPNVFEWVTKDSYEYFLSKNLISIPIDHRYTLSDMHNILIILNSLL